MSIIISSIFIIMFIILMITITTHPHYHQHLTSSLCIPSISSSYHDNHDNASSAFPVGHT